MSVEFFVDTNVLVYFRDATKPEKQKAAANWLSFLWETGTGRLSIQVITEFYAVVTRKLVPGMEPALAREDILDLFTWKPLGLDEDVITQAWDIQDRYQLSWWDSLIVAAAKVQQCRFLLSEDFQHAQDFHGLRIINPFLVEPGQITS